MVRPLFESVPGRNAVGDDGATQDSGEKYSRCSSSELKSFQTVSRSDLLVGHRFLLRFLFLLLGESYYFREKKTDMPSTTSYACELVGADAAVVDGLFRASEDLGYLTGTYSFPGLHQTHRFSSSFVHSVSGGCRHVLRTAYRFSFT